MSLPFLHSAADILRWAMVGLGLGSDPSTWAGSGSGSPWPIFATNEPSQPDNVLTVYDTTPKTDGRSMIDGERYQHYGVQVRVRSVDHPTGMVKAQNIEWALNERLYQQSVHISDNFPATYIVHCVSGITLLKLGKDTPTSKRSLFTINGMVAIERFS